MAHDIFISYSSKDKLIADGICAKLENAGIRCWIAPRDINPGSDFPTEIAKAIANSRIVILVFSQNANQSADISNELYLAFNNKITIIPFKIENVIPEPGKAYYLGRTHWLDAMTPPTLEQINNLIRTINSYLSYKQENNPPTGKKDLQKILFSNKRRLKLFIGIPVILLVLALGLFLFLKNNIASQGFSPNTLNTSDANSSLLFKVDFTNNEFDGKMPSSISVDQDTCNNITIIQKDKLLALQIPAKIQPSCHFSFVDVPPTKLTEIKEIDFTLLTSADTVSPHPSFGLIFDTSPKDNLFFVCDLGLNRCVIKDPDQEFYRTDQFEVQPGSSYAYKIEVVDPTAMKFRFSVNNEILGEYTFSKEKAQQFFDKEFNLGISVNDGNTTKNNSTFYLQNIDLIKR